MTPTPKVTSTPSISMMDLRSQPGTILDRVFYRNESLIVEKAGEQRAVLIPMAMYQDIQEYKAEARKRAGVFIDKMQANAAQYDPAEVQLAIDEAIEAVRKENLQNP